MTDSHPEWTTAALVGATGGAGTTRTTLELATTLSRAGRDVAVLDAAFATQGLADYLLGRLDPDLTGLLTDDADAPLDAGLVDLPVETPGRVACVPASAPIERFARAKTPEAAQRLARRIDAATARFDHVLVDTPPVAANQSIAAATTAERVALVSPGGTRGIDASTRARERLADIGVGVDLVVARAHHPDADVRLPASPVTDLDGAPTTADAGAELADAVATLAAELLGVPVDEEAESMVGSVGDYVP